MYHPDLERFRANRIDLINYDVDELELDQEYDDLDEKQKEYKLNEQMDSFTTDRYPDEDFTPDGWLRKQNYIDKSENSEFMNAFMPEYNEEACKAIQALKKNCKKDRKTNIDHSPKACRKNDSKETLKDKHDHLMLCRNIRLIETFSHCKTGDKWFKSKEIDHMSQLNKLARGASNCVDYFVDKKRQDQPPRQRSNYQPSDPKGYIIDRRTIPRRIKRSKAKIKRRTKSKSKKKNKSKSKSRR
jgi:hypothetical protein